MQTPTDISHTEDFLGERLDRKATKANLWQIIGHLWKWKMMIVGITTTMAIVSIIVSLLLPNWYKGSTRLLLPEGSGGGLTSALLGDVSDVAESIIGGSGDYKRYLAILSSRTAHENIVDSFGLETVYETLESETSKSDAIEILRDNVEFVIDDRYEFLSIEAFDKDPILASGIANEFAGQLNAINSALSAQSASQFREFVETRLNQALVERDSLQNLIQVFREDFGVLDFPIQLQVFYEQIAELRLNALQAEIEYEVLKSQLGPNNPKVLSYQNLVAVAGQNFENMLAGSEPLLPVAQDTLPALLNIYADLELKRTIQDRILEIIAPLVEQAKFDEQKQFSAVQIVDVAIPPEKKARPLRSIIVIVSTITAFMLACIFVIFVEWWRRNAGDIMDNLRKYSDS